MDRTRLRNMWIISATVLMAVLTITTGSLAAPPTKENPIVWKVETPWPLATWLHKDAQIWGKDIEEMSGGRMKIQLYCADELVPPFEIFNAVRTGTLDAGHTWAGYNIGKFPALTMMAATPAFMDLLGYIAWMQAGGGKELWQEIYGDSVVVYPAAVTFAETGGWSNKKIESLNDFKGLKYRTVLIWGQILSELGASVVTLPGGDIVPSLQRKTIDAAEFSTPAIDLPLGFYEVAKYNYYPGLHQIACYEELLINPKKWEALPDDLKAIVRRACDASLSRALPQFLIDDCKAVQTFREKGTGIMKFPKEMQQEIMERFLKKYDNYPDPMFQKVWASQKAFIKLYNPYMKLQTVEADVEIK
ncbi:MAG: TRAP transporter substrate-binding protein [Thermodesulfobacteriota bacterium]